MYYDQKKCGRRIAQLRKERGLTQDQLAENLNISTSTLGKLERGVQGCSIDLLIEIGFFFKVSTDYLLIGHSIPHYDVSNDVDAMIIQLKALKKKF